MHVLLLNDYAYPEGGASIVALTQAENLSKRGHDVTIFAAQAHRDHAGTCGWSTDAFPRTWVTAQWDIVRNPQRLQAVQQGIWNQKASNELANLLVSLNPNDTVILLHSWTKALSSSVVRRASDMGFKVVAVLHDYFVACPNGTYHDFRKSRHCWRQPLSIQCVIADCDRRARLHKGWRTVRHFVQGVNGRIPRGLSSVICVSNYQREILKPWLPAGMVCHLLPNPVSYPPEGVQSNVSKSEEFVFAGRMSSEKGAIVFAKAAAKANIRAVFVGDGEDAIQVSEILPAARITGWLDSARVWHEVSKAKALVFPSQWHETFGLSVYEAASLGVPAIVADGCAATEFVKHGKNGLLFRQGCIDDLADKLTQISVDPSLAAKLGAEARADFVKYAHSRVEYFSELEQFLYDALAGPIKP